MLLHGKKVSKKDLQINLQKFPVPSEPIRKLRSRCVSNYSCYGQWIKVIFEVWVSKKWVSKMDFRINVFLCSWKICCFLNLWMVSLPAIFEDIGKILISLVRLHCIFVNVSVIVQCSHFIRMYFNILFYSNTSYIYQ